MVTKRASAEQIREATKDTQAEAKLTRIIPAPELTATAWDEIESCSTAAALDYENGSITGYEWLALASALTDKATAVHAGFYGPAKKSEDEAWIEDLQQTANAINAHVKNAK